MPDNQPQTTGSLEAGDAAAAAVQKTPRRVTLDHLQSLVKTEEYYHPLHTPHMTICVLKVANGFTLVGQSAPADPGNFNLELGRKFAREDAIRGLWPLEGYLLCQEIHSQALRSAALDELAAMTQEAESGITDETGAGAGLDIAAETTQATAEEAAPVPPHMALQTAAQETAAETTADTGGQVLEARQEVAIADPAIVLPTVGRIVHVLFHHTREPHAGIVTGVYDDGTIDVTVFFRASAPDYLANVPYGLKPSALAGWQWPARV